MKVVQVVSGVMIRDGRLFLAQRVGTKSWPFFWESPGGKVEPGETEIEALRREMREELDISSIGRTWRFTYGGNHDGEVHDVDDPRPQEGQGCGWFASRELDGLTLIPGVAASLPMLRSLLP